MGFPGWALERLKSAHARNFLSLSVIQAVRLGVPLLALPWLSRVLGPDSFGLLMYMSVIPPIVALLTDWGFSYGATAEVARNRANPESLAQALGNVTLARIMLGCVCLLGAGAILPVLPHALNWPGAFALAVGMGLARGSSPLWFCQGLGQQLGLLAMLDAAFAALSLILTFIFVRGPADWPLYLAFYAACKFIPNLALTIGLWVRYRPRPSRAGALGVIRANADCFQGLFFNDFYPYGIQLVLGWFLAAADMGVIVAINKMLRALVGAILPVIQLVFPEACVLKDRAPDRARRLLQFSLYAILGCMCAAAGLVCLLSPWLTSFALGGGYASYSWILAVMVWAAPLRACAWLLGLGILVPYGFDKLQARVARTVGLASLPISALLAHCLGALSGALLPILVELALCAGVGLAILRNCPQALISKA